MHFTELFIRRPVMTTLVMLAILLFGAMSYRYLPVSDLPNVDFPTILVSANLPGASPETMASAVATPLERQFSTIAGLDSMNSTNALGLSQITLQFNLSRSLDAAAQDVQAAIGKASKQLPPDMPTPPVYEKVNPADQPVLYLAVTSETLPLSTVNEYADTLMAQRISMINGVAQVQIFGEQKFAVRVQLDPKALASRGLGINEVADAVKKENVNLPTGTLYGAHQAFTVQATGQLTTAAAYRPLIVAYRGGQPVRLSDLGQVLNSVSNDKAASWYKTSRAIVLAIQRQPGTNTIEVVDSINKLLPSVRSQIPASVKIVTLYDRSVTIRESVNDVQFTLLLALGLVIMVIFLFLRNFSATVIPSLALPMSIVGHLLRHVPAELQPGQPLLDGPDPVRGVRGGRRHRGAGKYRPAHGDGGGAVRGGHQRLPGDRLHHPLHDPVPGRGVYPGVLSGRYPGEAAPRIRGDHRRGHPGVRLCVPDPHPHAVQPVLAAAPGGAPRPPLRS